MTGWISCSLTGPKYVAMEFVAAGSHEASMRFPGLTGPEVARDLTVVVDDTEVYRGTKAMLLCLWALREYRHWSLRLAEPGRIHSTSRYFSWFSKHRSSLTFLRWLLP